MQQSGVPTYGAFVLDPGGRSGLAWGRYRDEGTVAERLAARERFGTDTVEGEWLAQAKQITGRWQEFRVECYRAGLPAYFVIEDFVLTRIKSSDRVGLYPVWIAAAIVGLREGIADAYERGGWGPVAPIDTIWQLPSQAKTYATDERLKRWDLWIRGREHERDACRHLAYFIANEKSQKFRLNSPLPRAHAHT